MTRNGHVFTIAWLCTLLLLPLRAQQPIRFDPATRVFLIDAAQSTYAFGIGTEGPLQNIYWGGKLMPIDFLPPVRNEKEPIVFESATASAPQEYGGWGNGMYIEPAL